MTIDTRREYRTYEEISKTLRGDIFEVFTDVLDQIGLTTADAYQIFFADYELAVSRYTDTALKAIAYNVYKANQIKYQKLVAAAKAEYDPIDNYNMVEESTDVRTPDLTNELTLNTTADITDNRSTTTEGSSNTTTHNQLNQQHITTETPNGYEESTIHEVNPSDNHGFAEDYRDTTTQKGTRTVTESYSGNPDETTTNVTGNSTSTNSGGTKTTNTGTNKQTETGTDTTKHTLTRKGNIGITSSQQLITAELELADKMNIFKVIEQDLAAKIFLQVWI